MRGVSGSAGAPPAASGAPPLASNVAGAHHTAGVSPADAPGEVAGHSGRGARSPPRRLRHGVMSHAESVEPPVARPSISLVKPPASWLRSPPQAGKKQAHVQPRTLAASRQPGMAAAVSRPAARKPRLAVAKASPALGTTLPRAGIAPPAVGEVSTTQRIPAFTPGKMALTVRKTHARVSQTALKAPLTLIYWKVDRPEGVRDGLRPHTARRARQLRSRRSAQHRQPQGERPDDGAAAGVRRRPLSCKP